MSWKKASTSRRSVVLCYFSGNLPTPHLNLGDFSLSLCGNPDKPGDRESERKDCLFLGMTAGLLGLTRAHGYVCCAFTEMPDPAPPPYSHMEGFEVFFERPCHLFNFAEMQTPGIFRGRSVRDLAGQRVLRAAPRGLARVSVPLGAVCCSAGSRVFAQWPNNRTLGLEDLYVSSVTWVCFGKEFLPEDQNSCQDR